MELIWLLIGFLGYWALVSALKSMGVLERYGVDAQGPILMLKTDKGQDLLKYLSKPKRYWRIYGNIGIAVAVFMMAITFLMLVLILVLMIQEPPEPSQVTEPQNILVIPGVNEFLPLSMAAEIILGLLIAIVVHEFGHGVMCKVEDIQVSSMGAILIAFLPLGAFVEPDEDEVDEAKSSSRTRMFSAGVMNNFVLTVITFSLLAASLIWIAPVPGIGIQNVANDSIASEAGIQKGEVIQSINGNEIQSAVHYFNSTRDLGGNVSLTVYSEGHTRNVDVYLDRDRGVEIRDVIDGYPAQEAGIKPGDRVVSVDEEEVKNISGLTEILDKKQSGETAVIGIARGDEFIEIPVTLTSRPGFEEDAVIGVYFLSPSEQIGITPYDINGVYSLLSSMNPIDWMQAIFLPLGQLFNGSIFFGFDGLTLSFYELSGTAKHIGGLYWLVPNVLFWTAWINFNLGVFNCIPALPLDGGHIFKEIAKKLLSPLRDEVRRESLADYATIGMSLAMLVSMIMLIAGPRLLN